MRVGVLVQARMSSERLPGKVLRDLAGRPLLSWLLEGLAQATTVDEVVLTTSTEDADSAVERFGLAEGVAVHRGALDDVLGRMLAAARASRLDAVVRVSGDSPLLDHRLVDEAVARWRAGVAEVVTNVFPRTYPAGQSVEVLGIGALELLDRRAAAPDDREHVTPSLYRDPAGITIDAISLVPPAPDVRMVVDTAEDLERMQRLVRSLARSHWTYRVAELVTLVRDGTAVGLGG